MSGSSSSDELLDFPCHYEFKAFGPGDPQSGFEQRVFHAVAEVIPVSSEAMKSRSSSGSKYQCVSVLTTLQNRQQLEAVYAALRKLDDLKYLL